MSSRRACLQLVYESVNITEALQPYLLGWTFTDNLSGDADDLQIILEDRRGLWSSDWMPEEGATLRAKIIQESWNVPGLKEELDLGLFEVDEIEIGGPPAVVTVKALSIPESTSLRGEKKNRAWEKTNLSVIAADIAGGGGLELFYDTDDDPELDRAEQVEQSDLEFLRQLCTDAGLCLKITDSQVVIFDEQKYENAEPVFTIVKGNLTSYKGRVSLTGTYRACRVTHSDASEGVSITAEFTPENPPKTKRVLVINERITSVADGEKLAMKRLRAENKEAVTITVSSPGDLRFLAGLTVALDGFGWFDGKYILTQVVHAQESGYVTRATVRRVLEGY